ncbi:unnamed protein product, partial [Ectocarpus fasciculatus]
GRQQPGASAGDGCADVLRRPYGRPSVGHVRLLLAGVHNRRRDDRDHGDRHRLLQFLHHLRGY